MVFKKDGKFLRLIDNPRYQYLWHQNTAIYLLYCLAKPNNTPHEQMSNLRFPPHQFYCGWHRSQPLQPRPRTRGWWAVRAVLERALGSCCHVILPLQTSGVHLACKLTILAKWCLWSVVATSFPVFCNLYLNNMFLLHFMTHKINLVVFGAWFTFFMFSSIIPISIYGWK